VTTNAIIFLCGAIAAFTVFAVALAYGEHQTRRFKRLEDTAKTGEPGAAKQDWLKAA
jgi:hypothetical protein